jgi:hypothetical protein
MTKEQLEKIQFRFVSSLSMAHEHCTVCHNLEYGFSFCTHTKKKSNGDFGRSHRHYMYQGKVYKSLDKFLEAIKDVEFKG